MSFAPQCLFSRIEYDPEEWDFVEPVERWLNRTDLATLPADTRERVTRENDQSTAYHRAFYHAVQRGWPLFADFVRAFIAPLVGEPFYYQRIPTFRLSLPDSIAVGETHCDADYGHPDGEINFWLGLTPAFDTNRFFIEREAGPVTFVDCCPGDIIVFDAVHRRHGNVPNATGAARVSFDFRCIASRLLDPSRRQTTVNSGLRFIPGQYYAAEVVLP